MDKINIKKNMVNNKPKEIKVKIVDEIKVKDKLLDIKFLIPIGISVIALLFSLNVFSPFKLQIYSSGAYIIPSHLSENSRPPKEFGPAEVMNFIIPIEFLNEGAKAGIVQDLYFLVEDKNEAAKYLPKYENDLLKLQQPEFWGAYNFRTKPFQPFGINGKDTITKTILFMPQLPGNVIFMKTGKYDLDIFVKTSRSEEFQKMHSLTLVINEDALNASIEKLPVFLRSPKGYDVMYHEMIGKIVD